MHPVPKGDPAHPTLGCIGGCLTHFVIYVGVAILGIFLLFASLLGTGSRNVGLGEFALLMTIALVGHSLGCIAAGWVYFWATRSRNGIHWMILAILLPILTFNPGDKILNRQEQGNPTNIPLWAGVLATLLFAISAATLVPLGARLKEQRTLS